MISLKISLNHKLCNSYIYEAARKNQQQPSGWKGWAKCERDEIIIKKSARTYQIAVTRHVSEILECILSSTWRERDRYLFTSRKAEVWGGNVHFWLRKEMNYYTALGWMPNTIPLPVCRTGEFSNSILTSHWSALEIAQQPNKAYNTVHSSSMKLQIWWRAQTFNVTIIEKKQVRQEMEMASKFTKNRSLFRCWTRYT